MSYTYLQEQGEESLAGCFSDIPASVLSRLNLTVGRSCSNGNVTESCRDSRYGMMSEPSTENRGEGLSMSSVEDSRVRTLARQGKERESKPQEVDCGLKWRESFARYDHGSRSWKTHQCSLFEGLIEFSETWPRWGMMRDGECWDAITQDAPAGSEREYGYLPSPKANDGRKYSSGDYNRNRISAGRGMDDLPQAVVMLLNDGDGKIGPQLPEWMMDWPDGWSGLQPLATDKFQQWLNSHGKVSQEAPALSNTVTTQPEASVKPKESAAAIKPKEKE